MQKLVFKNSNGVEIDLTSGNYGITEWNGFANVGLNLQTQQVPFSDGSVYLDGLLGEREISVTLAMQDNGNLEERYRMRRELITVLNPKLGEGVLIYTNDFTSKQIKAVSQIPVFENHNANDSGTPKASLSWTCPSPYWEDVEETTVYISKGVRQIIPNNGDVPCNVKINLQTGYIQEPFIKNITQSKIIKLNGNFNEDILIDTNSGKKSIVQEQLKFNAIDLGITLQQIAYSPLLDITIIAVKWGSESYPDVFGKNGIISYDGGESWEIFSRNIKSVYWCKEKSIFLACECIAEYRYQIITSSDGVNWNNSGNESTVPILQFAYNSITGMYLGVGRDSRYSTDLINWTYFDSYSSGYNSLLIQPDGTLLNVSSNGIYRGNINSMTKVHTGNFDDANICYSPKLSKYVVCAYNNNKLQVSSDGINWSEGATIDNNAISLKYENDNFILYANNKLYKSVDAENFIEINNSLSSIYDCLYINELGIYFLTGVGLYSTNDLQDFDDIFTGDGLLSIVELKYNSILNIYIAIASRGYENYVYTSQDLISWNYREHLGVSVTSDIIINEQNGSFIVAGQEFYFSSNGVNYTSIWGINNSATVKGIYDSNNQKFIFISSDYYVEGEPSNSQIILINANNYEDINVIDVETTYNINVWLKDIVYNSEEEEFVVIGVHSGYVGKSLNGEDWTFTQTTESESEDGYQVSLMLYSERLGKYVGIKDFYVSLSINAINWNRSFTFPEKIKAIIETDKYGLVVVGENGYMASSYDGNEWIRIDTFLKSNINSVNYSRNFLIGSEHFIILRSLEIEKKNIISSLSTNSDMSIGLEIGNNDFIFNASNGNANCTISYRQKYIGV